MKRPKKANQKNGFIDLEYWQAAGVAKNIGLVASGKQPTPVKLLPFDIYAVATGRSRGAGRAGSVKLLSFMVYMAKGKTLAVERMAGYIDGSVA